MPISRIETNSIAPSQTLTTPIIATTMGVGGATPSTSGSGITFPATQSASTDVNTLDDYEEGTFTPVLQGTGSNPTATYGGTNQGHYVKVGKMVSFRMNVLATSISGGSGTFLIGGLPFASTNYWTPVARGYADVASGSTPNVLMIINGGTSIYTWQNASTSVTSNTTGSYTTASPGATIDMYLSGTYFAS
jgi:hypothetical protein